MIQLARCRWSPPGSGLAFLTPYRYPPTMSRPLRIEFPGAVYHVTSRGDRRESIYRDDEDRRAQLRVIAQAMERFDAQVLAYCLMGNHFHLVLHTRQANLSRLMRHVNGVYTQDFNRRHGLVGHLFQGRFKAILVDRDAYLLALCRYVERNPVAAGLVVRAVDWPWSSFAAHAAQVETPVWLDSEGLHGYLLGRPVGNQADRELAARTYVDLVNSLRDGEPTIWRDNLRGQVFLGDDAFVNKMLTLAAPLQRVAVDVPKVQRKSSRSLQQCLAQAGSREQGIYEAYRDSGITMSAIAREMGLSLSRVSRLIAAAEIEGVKAARKARPDPDDPRRLTSGVRA
jgi:putative transposase